MDRQNTRRKRRLKRLSVVVPIFNEEENITPLCRELKNVLEALGMGYEVIFVDDGSTDTSNEVLQRLAKDDKKNKEQHIFFKKITAVLLVGSAAASWRP